MVRVNGHITVSSKQNCSLIDECKSKQNTHFKPDLCSGFTRVCSSMAKERLCTMAVTCNLSETIFDV